MNGTFSLISHKGWFWALRMFFITGFGLTFVLASGFCAFWIPGYRWVSVVALVAFFYGLWVAGQYLVEAVVDLCIERLADLNRNVSEINQICDEASYAVEVSARKLRSVAHAARKTINEAHHD